ncbi:MAG: S46 family peptidase, partial [Phycisphaerae bacterium]|nr:S46 family peptidase [Phycisphaerae bacterium]
MRLASAFVRQCLTSMLASALVAMLSTRAKADEGMWLLTHPPTAAIKSAYGFEPTAPWLEHLQKSAVRFSTGGSGSVVSKNGLVMTNHHVGSDMLAALSTPDRDLLELGFTATTQADELPCPDLALDILWSIEDVTAKVIGVAAKAKDDGAAGEARQAMIATLESESEKATGLKSEVVTLYQGGQYHLYRYRRFTDVRLVFAPESGIAFFGGDTDNFEYPRYNLDCCFFRIYDGGKPLVAEHFLTWSEAGATAEELIFVAGHPGKTQRLYTLDHLEFLRDVELPWMLSKNWRDEMKLTAFAQRNAENARIAQEDIGGVANGRKARTGLIEGLQDPALMAIKREREGRLRAAIAAKPELAPLAGAFDRVAQAQKVHAEIYQRRQLFEEGWRGPVLARIARHIVRLTEEKTKPNEARLDEYADARLDSIERSILSPEPIHEELEVQWLTMKLSFFAERLGAEDPVVVKLLDGLSPRHRAEALVRGTTLTSIDARKALLAGGAEAVRSSKDAMIAFMRALEPEARAVRTRYEREVESVERSAYADIAKATFAIEGDSTYPDA